MLWPGLAALLDPRQPVRGQFRRDCCCYGLRNGQRTGTAISSLSGAAATNATLAFLGGGTIAEGAGGMALGSNCASTCLPSARRCSSVARWSSAAGSKALTHARNVEADVNVAMAELDQTMTKLNGIDRRTSELGTLLDELRSRGVAALDLLGSEPFEPHAHAERFQRAMNLHDGRARRCGDACSRRRWRYSRR